MCSCTRNIFVHKEKKKFVFSDLHEFLKYSWPSMLSMSLIIQDLNSHRKYEGVKPLTVKKLSWHLLFLLDLDCFKKYKWKKNNDMSTKIPLY